ncbi:restriction endonuclease subunit S [Pseudomonas fluorescens]|uniref:restriction endonuclease subunit S n=1 Tax=Pseudomonas fluorescens TaxID=294 RepID=UPI001398F5CF|nr:restriction endonuclease subunit S [Pseudomonas fluorescens]QIA00919.1 restriction endonuclease subunit S [Pseudomonas fluorescens]
MALKLGYKQTEVGLIPESWSVSTVGDEFHIQLGKMLDADKNVGISKPFLGNRAVQWGRIDVADIGLIKLAPSDLQRFRLRHGDLLVCEGGEVGRSAIWRQSLDECYYQKALHRLRSKKGFNITFMQNILYKYSSEGFLHNYVTQTSIAHLPKDKFQTIPIPVPPLVEQQAIAEALSDADTLIESLCQLLTKKRQIKQGLMQELLTGKRRLPGFIGEWKLKRLDELASIQRGASPRPIDSPIWFDESSRTGWVRISDVTQACMFLEETTQRLSRKGIQNSRPVAEHSLIMSICATVGRPVITKIKTCIHDGFVVFDDLLVDQYFLYYVLCFIEEDWSRHGQTGSQMNLNTGLINSTAVLVPPTIEEQISVSRSLFEMDNEINTLETQLKKARQLKQGMMQELLTGRIRLV